MKIFLAARVLDTDPIAMHENAAVAVEGEKILWVRPYTAIEQDQQLDGAEVIDLGDVTLMPGLIDAHVHLGFDGGPEPVNRMMSENDAELLILMLRSARELLSVGVTTARDLGARGYLDIAVRDAIARGDARGPRLLTAGSPITPTGGHCWFMGGEADSDDEIRKLVRAHHKADVDHIKVMSTGGFMTHGSAPWYAQFTKRQLEIIVDEAHRVGKRVAAHAHGVEGIERALDAGVDTLEHCSFTHPDGSRAFVPELADRIAASNAYVSPTVNFRAPEMQRALGIEDFGSRLLGLYQAGAKIIASTDAGIDNTPHRGFVGGLVAMEEFGIPRDDVLVSATSLGARGLGLAGQAGSLAEGARADLIAVAGNPRDNLAALHDLRFVLSAGVPFVPDDLDDLPSWEPGEMPSILTTAPTEILSRIELAE